MWWVLLAGYRLLFRKLQSLRKSQNSKLSELAAVILSATYILYKEVYTGLPSPNLCKNNFNHL